jgi:CheY-like chemotaxis protein
MVSPFPHTILLVDDEPKWQNIVKELCESAGYHMESAFNVTEALVQCQHLRPLPILALVDLHLPGWVPQNTHVTFDGERLLVPFRNLGIYTVVLSSYLSEAEEALLAQQRPELLGVISKYNLSPEVPSHEEFRDTIFPSKLHAFVAAAEAARRAEGQLPEQQERLRALPLSPFPPS